MNDSIENRINKLIVETSDIDISKIQLKSSLIDDLGFDSLDDVELVIKLEDEFNIEITDDEASKIFYVQDLYDLVKVKYK